MAITESDIVGNASETWAPLSLGDSSLWRNIPVWVSYVTQYDRLAMLNDFIVQVAGGFVRGAFYILQLIWLGAARF